MRILRYSEDQPRDDHGRFGEGGETASYPKAGKEVDGLTVGSSIPNQSSIAAELTDYEVQPGIREVPMSDFKTGLNDLFYAKDDKDSARNLAEKIKESERIDPLIVVVDKDGPYVLEGGHRLGALGLLGKTSFPAMVVHDKTEQTGIRMLRYSEDQPRDDHGRFGEGSGEGSKTSVISSEGWVKPDGSFHENKSGETHVNSAERLGIGQPADREEQVKLSGIQVFNNALAAGAIRIDTENTLRDGNTMLMEAGKGDKATKDLMGKTLDRFATEKVRIEYLVVTKVDNQYSSSVHNFFGTIGQAKTWLQTGKQPSDVSKFRSIESYVSELLDRAAKMADTPGGKPTVVYFMRHGQTDSDKNNLFGGQTNEEMNAAGIADIQAAISDVVSLLDFDLVFSDGLQRTHHSAEMVLPFSRMALDVIVNANATAWGCGDLSGLPKTPENIAKKKFYVQNPTVVPPSTPDSVGESIQHSEHRWLAFLAYVISLTPPGDASFVACHSSGIKVISKTYGTRIKVNPGGIVRMTIAASGITFDILRNGLPETITPDAEDERKRLAALEQKRSKHYADAGEYNEADEAIRRKLAMEMAQYAESGNAFDPKGDYLCGGCSQMALPSACGVVSGHIKPADMSCRFWVKDIPLVQLETKFKPKEVGLTERPNVKGFGCKRCEYGAEAKTADSAGRKSWCSWWGIHVLADACCAMNEGDDDVVIK